MGPGPVTFATPVVGTPAPQSDSQTLDAAQLRRIQAFRDQLEVFEGVTDEILSARAARMVGATLMNTTPKFRWYRIPEPADGCPALGPLELSWQDIFDAAKENLRALAAFRPPRWCAGADLIRWVRVIRWNAILLQDATNIRPLFRYPQDIEGAAAATDFFPSSDDQRRGSSSTLYVGSDDGQTEGMPYPGGSGSDGVGIPLAVRQRLRAVAARWSDEDPRNGAGYQLPLWITMLDWSAAWPNVDAFGSGFVFFPRVGDVPGAVVDLDLERYGRGFTPWISRAIDKAWRDGKYAWVEPGPLTSPYPYGNVGARVSPWRIVDDYAAIAEGYATLDLPTMLLESIGWYVNNHLVYWRNRGLISLDERTLQSLQAAARSARMRQGLAPAGAIASLAQSVNPVVGAVVSALQEIGFELLDVFIGRQLDNDGPRRLFVRNYPSSCIGIDTEAGLTLGSEEAGTAAALAQRSADQQATAELEARTEQLRRERLERSSGIPWVKVGIGAGIAAAVGLGIKFLAK